MPIRAPKLRGYADPECVTGYAALWLELSLWRITELSAQQLYKTSF